MVMLGTPILAAEKGDGSSPLISQEGGQERAVLSTSGLGIGATPSQNQQALPPIQFVEGDADFTAANQERVDLVKEIPGLVALWDFVHRRGAMLTKNPFISIPGKSGGHTYELEPRNISLDFWHQGPEAKLDDFELFGRGPFGQAVRFEDPVSEKHLPVLSVLRKYLHDTPLDIKGEGKSVTMVVHRLVTSTPGTLRPRRQK